MRENDMGYFLPHGFDCREVPCDSCLSAAESLAAYLKSLHPSLEREDVLSKYRSYLDHNGIDAENEWGWPTENVYRQENIDGFINSL